MTTEKPEGQLVPSYLVAGVEAMYASATSPTRFLAGAGVTESEAEREERTARVRAAKVEAWRLYDAAVPALAAITDPLARAILDLHCVDSEQYLECQGCDFGGYEAEKPEWPCRTVQAVAAQYDIELPSAHYLWSRP